MSNCCHLLLNKSWHLARNSISETGGRERIRYDNLIISIKQSARVVDLYSKAFIANFAGASKVLRASTSIKKVRLCNKVLISEFNMSGCSFEI